MNRKPNRAGALPAAPDKNAELAPITAMMSSRLMVLANLLKRGAILRYKRLAGLSSVEFGLVASLGRPVSTTWPSETVRDAWLMLHVVLVLMLLLPLPIIKHLLLQHNTINTRFQRGTHRRGLPL